MSKWETLECGCRVKYSRGGSSLIPCATHELKAVTPTPQDKEQEDYKLVIFGWITTVLGIPKDADPTKYNELADRLYELFTAHTVLAEVEARKDENNKKRQFYELMRSELVKHAEAAGYKTSTTIKAVNQVIAEIDLRLADLESQATLLREAK